MLFVGSQLYVANSIIFKQLRSYLHKSVTYRHTKQSK